MPYKLLDIDTNILEEHTASNFKDIPTKCWDLPTSPQDVTVHNTNINICSTMKASEATVLCLM
jgi:hypothetical protein